MASTIHISLSAETIFSVGGFDITNSMFTSLLISALIIIFAISQSSKIKNSRRPSGLQNVLEAIIGGFYDMVYGIAQDKKKTDVIFPFAMTFFLFIILNNWFGLLPGVGTIGVAHPIELGSPVVAEVHAEEGHDTVTTTESTVETVGLREDIHEEELEEHEEAGKHAFIPVLRPGTADLNTTLALALVSIVATQFIGFKFLGTDYSKKFLNFSGPIDFFVGFLEIVSEVSKIISFAFRLFGNIFAGEVLLTVIAFLVPVIASIPFIGLEIFVGFIQALVFMMLTIVFMSLATQGHGDHEHH